MPKSVLLAALVAAAPAWAQTPAPAPAPQPTMPPPEFMAAAQGYGECLKNGSAAAPATATPEAAAHQAVLGCEAQRKAMQTSFDAWIAGPGFPEESRAPAREQLASQLAGVEAKLADAIRSNRAGAAAAPAPTATPTPKP